MEIALRWLPIMVSLGRISFRVVRFAGMRLRQRRDLDHAGLADKDVVAAAVDGDPGLHDHVAVAAGRSEERRVGQECVSKCCSRRAPDHYEKKTAHYVA